MLRSTPLIAIAFLATPVLAGTPFVPGTGDFLANCSDDFEDPKWSYRLNLPKSSYEQDDNQRGPGGYSNNKLWHEGAKRGTPDVVKRVATPPGGIEGSTGAMLMQTRYSGIPGKLTGQQQQDDLLMKFDRKLRRPIPVTWSPSCTVRVYIRPFDEWENRTGPSFGMRGDCRGRMPDGETAAFWPGMFILFRSETSRNIEADYAQVSVRANGRGQDMKSVEIKEPGWWTLGMSFSPDGQIHYYASEGVDDLTEDDYLTSAYPYNYKCLCFNNFFFNVANWDNGQSLSTPWVIDDPKIFVIPPTGQSVATLPRRKGQRVPMFPITHVHEADKPKNSGGGFFGRLFGSGSNRSATGRSTRKRR
ncbi:MAG: hypothetical protein AAGB00_03555 [Planctomycetota bacterium]